MKKISKQKSSWGVIVFAFEALVFAPVIISSFFFQACSNTIEEVHDTVIHHDTISGPAFLRFLAILNNTKASSIIHLKMYGQQNPYLFTDVNPEMQKQFIPVMHDSTLLLYANYFYGTGTQKFDSLAVPPLKSYSMTTIVLFRTNDPGDPNRLFAVFADDSVRRLTAPKDSCFVRLINGLPDYPQPSPTVNLHVDDINAPSFFRDISTGISSPVNFEEIRNYVLMPAGFHKIFVRSESDISQSYSASQQFIEGQFYTIRLTGSKLDGSDKLTIDTE